ncbi:unnamed protein product [Anisakis simplex]|uniref:E3 ubiquitin-protein ligase n=1 Tax=Anisakis simplex TaxID=6269 RepID=A0A0M3J119_ANISI|nr:unnamed protein product [Anisakis simplex]
MILNEIMKISSKSEVRHYECPICGDTTASTLSHPVGALVSIVNNYVVEHSLPSDGSPLSLLDWDAETLKNNGCLLQRNMMKHCDVAKRMLLEQRFPVFADLVQVPTGVEVRTCGHFAHMKCYKAYVQTLWESPPLRVNPLDLRIDVSCPMNSLPEKSDDAYTYKRDIVAVQNSLQKTNPPLQESDVESFIKYRQTFTNFIMRCEKWTTYRGDVGERLRAKGQSFTLGLAKANVERNVLLSELDITDRSNRLLPTGISLNSQHLIYAARYEGVERDIVFANYQWRQLTDGFLPNTGHSEPEDSRENSPNPTDDTTQSTLTSSSGTTDGPSTRSDSTSSIDSSSIDSSIEGPNPPLAQAEVSSPSSAISSPDSVPVPKPVPDDSDILASSTEAAKKAMRLSTRAVERETGTPVMLFDMKSAITRLSSYVITNDCLMNDDKIGN